MFNWRKSVTNYGDWEHGDATSVPIKRPNHLTN
jgi:hypothetical protein